MKLLRYIYPLSGINSKEKDSFPRLQIKENPITDSNNNRFEIFNLHGEIICITRKLKMNNLKLEKGFYLIKEKDENGKFIKSSKLILE